MPRSILRRGSAGSAVTHLQQLLVDAGFDIERNGDFDLPTDAAVCAAQRSANLTLDGIVGDRTWEALEQGGIVAPDDGRTLDFLIDDAPYFSQRDNTNNPFGTCNVTCLAMALTRLGVSSPEPALQLEDHLFDELRTPEGLEEFERLRSSVPAFARFNPWNVHAMLTWLAIRKGRTARFTTQASWDQIWDHVREVRVPVIVSGDLTHSGHIVAIVGRTAGGDPVVHDPFGEWRPRGRYQSENGHSRVYFFEVLDRLLEQSPTEKWAHFIQ